MNFNIYLKKGSNPRYDKSSACASIIIYRKKKKNTQRTYFVAHHSKNDDDTVQYNVIKRRTLYARHVY